MYQDYQDGVTEFFLPFLRICEINLILAGEDYLEYMNRTLYVLLFVVLVVLACNKVPMCGDEQRGGEQLSLLNTKGSALSSSESFFVTEEDILQYVSFMQSFREGKGINRSNPQIETVSSRSEITSYIVNYDNGWEIIAADKRCQMVLACSEDGHFVLDKLPVGAQEWLADLNTSVSGARAFHDRQHLSLDLNPVEQANVEYWDIIESPRLPQTRDDLPPGHWELLRSRQTVVEDGVEHLIPVKWGQGTPYNNYCPLYRINDTDYRSAAGCVAVAGAQLLYYLHYQLGVPATAPSVGSVSGYAFIDDYPGYYFQSFSNPTSTIWDEMATHADSTAALIGSLGKAVNMDYGIQSGAFTWDLANYCLDSLGLTWNWCVYSQASDSTYVIQSINNNSPVLVDASSQGPYGRHAFLIDAWKQQRYCYECSYEYVFDDPNDMQSYVFPEILEITTYSAPFARFFAMNWGSEGAYDDVWYAPFGVWNPGNNNYNGTRQLFHHFTINNS